MFLIRKKNTFFIEKWEVDPVLNTINNGSEQLEVEPKAMQVLEHLARNAGQTVHRDDLFNLFWPNQVVTEEALTRVISHLRQCFADTPTSPRYIVTIRKSGYRLIAKVSGSDYFEAHPLEMVNYTEQPSIRNEYFSSIKVIVIVIVLSLIYMAYKWPIFLDLPKYSSQFITSEQGAEQSPNLSPNGAKLVYYKTTLSSEFDGRSTTGLYIKNIESNKVETLPTPDGRSTHPVWSPDMQYIAYAHEIDRSDTHIEYSIYITNTVSGEFKKLADTLTHNHGLSWSPDGKFIVYPDGPNENNTHLVYRLDVETGQNVLILPSVNSENAYVIYSYPKYSPDGSHIAVIRTDHSSYGSIDIIDTRTNQSTDIYSTKSNITSIEWKNYNTLFVVQGHVVKSQLLELSIDDGLINPIKSNDKETKYLSYSRKTKRLAYEYISRPYNIYSIGFENNSHPLDIIRFTKSSQQELEAVSSSDGRYTAIISTRSGAFEIWLRDNLENQSRKLTSLNASSMNGMDWSIDNKYLSFVATAEYKNALYWIDIESLKTQSFSDNHSHFSLIGWDKNNALVFSSNLNDNWRLWRLNTSNRELELLSNSPVSNGRLSPDRGTLYFAKHNHRGIWKSELDQMDPVFLQGTKQISTYNSWTVSESGLYYFVYGKIGMKDRLNYLGFKTLKTEFVTMIENVYFNRIYWSNNRLYYSVYMPRESNVVLLEGL